MEESNMNTVFARRLKAQQAIGCLALDDSSHIETNQENEGENYPVYVNDSPKCKSLNVSNDLSSPFHPSVTEYSPFSDRYIPQRDSSSWHSRFSFLSDNKVTNAGNDYKRDVNSNDSNTYDGGPYSSLLRNELLGTSINDLKTTETGEAINGSNSGHSLFQFSSPVKQRMTIDSMGPYSLSPVGPHSHKLLRSGRKTIRKISRIPFKILDAPELQDDFYLNLVDWSSQNVLAVGLGTCVYLWSACTSQVTHLCDFTADMNSVTSVAWNERGNLVAVGTNNGTVEIYDGTVNKQVLKLSGHMARVGSLAWNGDVLSSGSRDRFILQRDMRTPPTVTERKLPGHRQEVCGLKWSSDNQHLASGGNDNRLCVWNMHSTSPIQIYSSHTAAVKAIAWSPHHQGLLASGGGTADRCIRFWNTLIGQQVHSIDTGSQVCNLAWSKHFSELISTHGYSQNQILVWKYPSMTQVTKLTGHASRVLYLSMSPDGESIVTGAGDETLRFWNVFPKVRSHRESKSVLNLFGNIR